MTKIFGLGLDVVLGVIHGWKKPSFRMKKIGF